MVPTMAAQTLLGASFPFLKQVIVMSCWTALGPRQEGMKIFMGPVRTPNSVLGLGRSSWRRNGCIPPVFLLGRSNGQRNWLRLQTMRFTQSQTCWKPLLTLPCARLLVTSDHCLTLLWPYELATGLLCAVLQAGVEMGTPFPSQRSPNEIIPISLYL